MSAPLSEHIDILRLARQGRKLSGRISLHEMYRLKQYLATEEPGHEDVATDFADIEVAFGIDDEKIVFISGTVQAEVTMICQRCLERTQIDLNVEFLLGAVENETGIKRLPEQYEPLLISGKSHLLSEIIEDELILALPLVAIHETDLCAVEGSAKIAETENETGQGIGKEKESGNLNNPFSVLSSLKKELSKD